MTDYCPECGEPVQTSRKLTEGTHKHDTNFLQKIDADGYCISYETSTSTHGAKAYAKIYLHKHSEGENHRS